MEALKFQPRTLNTIENYLSERKQYVSLNATDSDILVTGPNSVTQGSTLSCAFYLLYILDLFHPQKHNVEQYRDGPSN